MVMIGIDPHKSTHTAVAIDGHEVELARFKLRVSKRQSAQLLAWARGFEDRAWAIESAAGLGYLLAQQLLAAGETVVDVPATLAARVRVLGTGRSDKNDPNDARAVAVAALRAPALTVVRPEDHVTVQRVLAKRNLDLARWRNKVCCRLHALVAELHPGGISKEIVVAQASQLLTANNARSMRRRRSKMLGKKLPWRSFGIASSTSPALVVNNFERVPLR